MDSDGVYRRVNINKVMEQILKNNPNLTESKAQELALIMIKELNKKIISIYETSKFTEVLWKSNEFQWKRLKEDRYY